MDYYDGIAEDVLLNAIGMVIWYQGGPAANSGEPYNLNPYTNEQALALNFFRQHDFKLIHFTQSAGVWDSTTWKGTENHALQTQLTQFDSIFPNTLPVSGGWTPKNFSENILGISAVDGISWSQDSLCSTVHGSNATNGTWEFGRYPVQRVLGEGYIGPGSSGAAPTYSGYRWAYMDQGQTVRGNTALSFQDPFDFPGSLRGIGDHDLTFRSWGNTISGSYTIGYAWADLSIISGMPYTPTRAQILQNIMASLDPNIFNGGSNNRKFHEYEGPDPAIVSIMPIFWGDDGSYTEGDATAPGSGMYPDDTSTDVFRSTVGANNNEIIRASGNGDEDGLNGNDIDMQAPFYGYWHYGLDGAPGGGDDEKWAGGALVHNVDANTDSFDDWQLQAGDPGVFGNPAGSRLVSGYYTNDSALDPATDDGHLSASYGFQPAHLSFDGRAGSVSFEAIARWAPTGSMPYGLEAHGRSPARLRWCLYPGHGVVLPDAGASFPEYGKRLSWKQFLGNHNIANGGSGTYNNAAAFLRPSFGLGGNDKLTGGRITDLDYRNIAGWYTDFNGNFVQGDEPNGTDDPGDKFPYRARLITGWSAYFDNTLSQTTWPNRMPDPGSYIELGGYILDTSVGDPGVMIVDDPECDDPYLSVDNTAYPVLYIDLCFEIIGGIAPYEVSLDPAYDLETYDPLNPLATFDDVLGLDLTWTEAQAGLNSETVTLQGGNGFMGYFALRVIDVTGVNQDMFIYPDLVYVGPPD